MRTLITGDKGYIGSHLAAHFPAFDGCDLKAGKDYQDIEGEEYDLVIHLAAFVSVTESFDKALEYFINNCFGVRKLLRSNKIGRFVFTSTGGAIYGNKVNAREEDASFENCLSP